MPLSVVGLLVAGLLAALVTLVSVPAGLALLVLSVPFGALREFSVAGFSLSATEGLVLAVALSWALGFVARREARLRFTPVLGAWLALVAALLLSTSSAVSLPASLKELLKWAEFGLVFLVVVNTVRTRRAFDALVVVVLLAGSAEALVGLYQFATRSGPEPFLIGERFLRAYGTFAQPNPFGGYMGLVLPLALAAFLGAVAQRRGRWPALLALAGMALIGAGLLASLSRGAWLGFAGALVVMALLWGRRLRGLVALGGLGVVLAALLGLFGLLPSELAERMGEALSSFGLFDARQAVLTPGNYALVERMAFWQAAWHMFLDSPLIGQGIGNYPVVYPTFALPGWEIGGGHAHNYYLNTLAEAGLVGLGAYLVFLAVIFWYSVRSLRLVSEACDSGALFGPGRRCLGLGLLGVLVAASLHNGFDNLYVHGMIVQVAFTVGLLAVLPRLGEEKGQA